MNFKTFINEKLDIEKTITDLETFSKLDNKLVIGTNKLFPKDNSEDGYEASNLFWTEDQGTPKIVTLKVKDLLTTQDLIYPEKLRETLKNTSKDLPEIIKYNEKYYIVDGHHRIAADILNKKSKIKVKLYNLR